MQQCFKIFGIKIFRNILFIRSGSYSRHKGTATTTYRLTYEIKTETPRNRTEKLNPASDGIFSTTFSKALIGMATLTL